MLKAYPETKDIMETNNKLSIDYFLRGLNDKMGEQVSILKPKTLEITIEQAMRIESKNQIKRKTKVKQDIESKQKMELNVLTENKSETSIGNQIESYKNDLNNIFKQLHEKMSKNIQKEQEIEEKLNVLIESNKRQEQNNRKKQSDEYQSNQHRTVDRYSIQCEHCNKKGHSYETCYYATENDKKRIQSKNHLKSEGRFSNSQKTKKP